MLYKPDAFIGIPRGDKGRAFLHPCFGFPVIDKALGGDPFNHSVRTVEPR
jgi:hypothetical protein